VVQSVDDALPIVDAGEWRHFIGISTSVWNCLCNNTALTPALPTFPLWMQITVDHESRTWHVPVNRISQDRLQNLQSLCDAVIYSSRWKPQQMWHSRN